jgi:hypothetical protein
MTKTPIDLNPDRVKRYIEMLNRMIASGEGELAKCRTSRDRRYVEASLARLREQKRAALAAEAARQ